MYKSDLFLLFYKKTKNKQIAIANEAELYSAARLKKINKHEQTA
jgi:hypothetical protein